MIRPLHIAVADDEPEMREYYRVILPRLGHEVVCTAGSGAELVAQCLECQPDLIITDICMPDMDGIDAVALISRQQPLPVILVSAYHDEALIERTAADCILAYLVKPILQSDLETAIPVAWRRFEQFQALRSEATSLKQALEDRKLIERAKGVLMKKVGLDEDRAFRRMQRLACDQNRKLVEIARVILSAERAFDPSCL
jgi:response regulator NasT